jgi:hypothetical protein
MGKARFAPLLLAAALAAGCARPAQGPAASAAKIELQTCRPRLFFRPEQWAGGLSVAELRARAAEAPFKERLKSLRSTLANLALKWLVAGDEAAATECLAGMHKWSYGVADSEDGVQIIDLALAYDWLFGWSGFGEEAKRAVEAKLLAAAGKCREELSGKGAHVYHTRMYAWCAALGVAALALHDRAPAGRELFLFAKDYYETRLVPARRLQGGTWHCGPLYAMNAMMLPLLQYLEASKSAAGLDYFHTADPAASDWLREMPEFMVCITQPDMRTVNYADLTERKPEKHFRFALDIFAKEYRDGHAAELARRISERYQTSGYHAEWLYLFFAFHDPAVSPRAFDDLPTFRVFSREGTGQVFFRSDWSAGGTLVHFRCGDYFDDHGHFDQGGLTIFRRRELALKSGFYDFASDHRKHYYKQAISTNAVIFQDPRDAADEGQQRNMHYQEAATLGEYLKRKTSEPFVETGNIVAVDDPARASSTGRDFHFVTADLTPAWDAKKVKRWVRHVAFVDGRHLVVVDETETTAPEIRARWLLHSSVEPAADGPVWKVALPEAVLYVRPLLPEKLRATVIGGEGRECDVNGTNWTYLAAKKYNAKPGARPDPALGLWRLELEHPEPAAKRLFVTVLTADDPGSTAPAASARLAGGKLTVTVGATAVTFHKLGP